MKASYRLVTAELPLLTILILSDSVKVLEFPECGVITDYILVRDQEFQNRLGTSMTKFTVTLWYKIEESLVRNRVLFSYGRAGRVNNLYIGAKDVDGGRYSYRVIIDENLISIFGKITFDKHARAASPLEEGAFQRLHL